MAINKVIMTGRLTACPELKQTPSGVSVCSFTIAQNKGKDAAADFFDCIAWRQTAEFVSRYFKKGDGIEIDGRLTCRTFEKDNVKRKVYEIECKEVFFPAGKAKHDETPSGPNCEQFSPDDDLPY